MPNFSHHPFPRTLALRTSQAATHSHKPPSSSSAASSTSQWNSTIRTRLHKGHPAGAIATFAAMLRSGARPDAFSLVLLNRAASALTGRKDLVVAAHSVGFRAGFRHDIYFCNTLIEAYTRHGMVAPARQLLDEMRARDVVSWTSLMSGYVSLGDMPEVCRIVSEMQVDGCEPTNVTAAVLLRACTAERDIIGGRQLHCFSVKSGLYNDRLVHNSILTHLSRSGSFEDAVRLFEQASERDTVSWNIVISEYFSAEDVYKVVNMYERMRREEVCPSCETLTVVVAAFAKHGCLRQGEKLHSFAVRSGLIDRILMASLVDFYGKCGKLALSFQLFEELKGKSSVIWASMICAFIHNGQFVEAIHLFGRMLSSPFAPSADMLQGLVVSYTELGALHLGKATHGFIIRNNHATESENSALETSIVTMYATCGSLHLARRCFDSISQKDIVAWSSMIEAYAIHGDGADALSLFHQMQEEGVRPSRVTFLSLLSACSHSGLVSEACKLFDCMTRRFGITPELGHYTCMVDMLGRSGNLDEALRVISGMKVKPDGRIWGALLASCRTHLNTTLAAFAARKLMELEPDNVGYHVVLSNIQAGDDRWGEVEDIRSSIAEMDLQKLPAWSCITETG